MPTITSGPELFKSLVLSEPSPLPLLLIDPCSESNQIIHLSGDTKHPQDRYAPSTHPQMYHLMCFFSRDAVLILQGSGIDALR